MSGWDALATRARGLGRHLLSREQMGDVSDADTMQDFHDALQDTVYRPFLPDRGAPPEATGVAITRSVAERTGVLARWGGPAGRLLAAPMLEQDVENVRTIVRGARGALSPEQRLTDVVPTPSLGRRALETLARAESTTVVAATLATWGHPLARAFTDEEGRPRSDLFALEIALAQVFAFEAAAAAKRAGSEMRDFVRDSLDGRNVVVALVLSGARSESDHEAAFVEGGRHLSAEDFNRAVAAEDRARTAELLAESTRGSFLEGPLREPPVSASGVSLAIETARIERLRRRARLDPVSALPVLLFMMLLKRETRLLAESLWRVTLAGARRT